MLLRGVMPYDREESFSFRPFRLGNFGEKEGYGTTGYSIFIDGKLQDFSYISSEDFDCIEAYWLAHEDLILSELPDIVLMESYKLFEHKAKSQSWSTLDTPRLIGALMLACYKFHIPIVFQDPQQKQGVTDERLVKLGYFEKRGRYYYCNGKKAIIHERDAIRHGIYYFRYGKGKTNGKITVDSQSTNRS